MTQKKYASLESLQIFKENSDKLYATQENVDEISNTLDDKANATHTHTILDITNLQSTIDEINDNISQKSQIQMTVTDNSEITTEILSTLNIHKLTQEQYEEKLENGTLEDNAIYLTPDEEVDLSGYATIEQLDKKSDIIHTHNISDINELQSTLDEKVSTIRTVNGKSLNEDIVLSATDVGADIVGSANNALSESKAYADSIKNDLLNGAGDAYDTLKELSDLIDENTDAIEALEIIAVGKADASHIHNDIYYTETEIDEKVIALNTSVSNSLNEAKSYTNNVVAQKSQVQIITWEDDD